MHGVLLDEQDRHVGRGHLAEPVVDPAGHCLGEAEAGLGARADRTGSGPAHGTATQASPEHLARIEALVQLAQAGDAEAFGQIYESYVDVVYRYVYVRCGSHHLAEDLTALAFERAFRRRRLFNPRRGSERAWLFGIARNAALDELRRRRRSTALVGDVRTDAWDGAEETEGVLRRVTVRAALAGLTPRERELIALKFHAGLSNPDIARVLGVSESNAGTLLHRTITKLRKACDEEL